MTGKGKEKRRANGSGREIGHFPGTAAVRHWRLQYLRRRGRHDGVTVAENRRRGNTFHPGQPTGNKKNRRGRFPRVRSVRGQIIGRNRSTEIKLRRGRHNL